MLESIVEYYHIQWRLFQVRHGLLITVLAYYYCYAGKTLPQKKWLICPRPVFLPLLLAGGNRPAVTPREYPCAITSFLKQPGNHCYEGSLGCPAYADITNAYHLTGQALSFADPRLIKKNLTLQTKLVHEAEYNEQWHK
jgi:hypothetical protein